MECSICFESLDQEAFSTICGHTFCNCINDYVKTSGRCPNCSKTLTTSDVFKLFLPRSRNSIENVNNSSDKAFNDVVLESVLFDMDEEKKKSREKFNEMREMLDNIAVSFSQIDIKHDIIVEENKQLKNDIAALKLRIADLENSERRTGQLKTNAVNGMVSLGN